MENKQPTAIEQVLSEYILDNANLKIYNKELEAEVNKLSNKYDVLEKKIELDKNKEEK